MTQPELFSSEAHPARVMLVDDEFGPREAVGFSLSVEFAVHVASSGQEAIDKARAEPFSVIILDMRMPVMDGLTALGVIRSFDPDVSVIMMSGYTQLALQQACLEAGANLFLPKPADLSVLIPAVRMHIMEAARRRAVHAAGGPKGR